MARLKRLDVGRVGSADVVVALDAIIDGLPRPGRAHPEADAAWAELRAMYHDAVMGHEAFDPRLVLTRGTGELARWREMRRHWLATDVFATDPRVLL